MRKFVFYDDQTGKVLGHVRTLADPKIIGHQHFKQVPLTFDEVGMYFSSADGLFLPIVRPPKPGFFKRILNKFKRKR